MTKIAEYRFHAEQCRTLARTMQNQAERDQLLRIAQAWDRFAAEREKRAEKSGGQP
jgi:hypothetical protein